jgi:hypothetical protein
MTEPNDWVVAIPTYQRVETIARRTLTTLREGGVPAALIHLFVASEAERASYAAGLDASTYGKIIVGVPGLGAQRNFITDHYPDGARLVQSDDDVDGVWASPVKGSNDMSRVTDLVELFNAGFEACTETKARIWGLYPLCNGFFMSGNVTFDLRPIIGTLYGNVNDKKHRLVCAIKSDIERTLLYWQDDRVVVRYNGIAPKQRARSEPGGHQTGTRTLALSKEAADYLVKTYPKWCRAAPSRKGGHAEVKLVKG